MEAKKKRSPLAEAEREVWAEGREWMRRRLEQKLQQMADRESPELSPPQPQALDSDQVPSDQAGDDGGRGGH